jgi:protein AATF/BFR2
LTLAVEQNDKIAALQQDAMTGALGIVTELLQIQRELLLQREEVCEKPRKMRKLNANHEEMDDAAWKNAWDEIDACSRQGNAFQEKTLTFWQERLNFVSGAKSNQITAFRASIPKSASQAVSNTPELLLRSQKAPGNSQRSAETYWDTDFYGMLLKELIENDSKDASGKGVGGGNRTKALSLSKNRVKNHRPDVDTKASKGRKLRYEVMPQLVNFMPPIGTMDSIPEIASELFENLFR